MALVRGTTVVDDPWRALEADEVLPADEPVIIGKARYLAERDGLAGRNAPLGLLIVKPETTGSSFFFLSSVLPWPTPAPVPWL